MSDEPSVTVGIPTYDNEDTIETTLRQLVEGTRPPDRIIVVDASSDATPDIVDRVAAETEVRIDRFDQSDRGRGVGAARQDIYEQFEGDILACLDTDIRVHESWLEDRVAFHRENPEFDVLSSTPIDGIDGEVTDPKRGYFFQQANSTLTAEVLDRVDGWDPWFPRGEDWDMQIRLWRADARTYAKSSLHGELMETTGVWEQIRKTRGRPSSVAFLRKYGPWYLRFHPEHVLGDVASVGAWALLLLAIPLLVTAFPLGVLAVALAVAPTLAYLYLKRVKHRAGWFRRDDVFHAARFYLLGLTALRELVLGEDYPWNYGGVSDE